MSGTTEEHQVKDCLAQLKCHFTWELAIEEAEIPDLESRVLEHIENSDTNKVPMYNLQAYVEHLKGHNDKALQSLEDAESLIQKEHADQSDTKSLVTWSNYAWVCYHLGRLADARMYLDKVESTCKKLASPFRFQMACPEVDCEEGWALLKCGGQNYKRAEACFEKALKAEPENPEFNAGYAIVVFRQDCDSSAASLEPLRKALRLNPEDGYLKVLLALKLQDKGKEAEGEKYIEEALSCKAFWADVFPYAAKFYRRKGCVDEALRLYTLALQASPNSAYLHHQIGLCHKAKMFQMKGARTREEREIIDKLAQLAIGEFQTTISDRPTFEMAYINLAEVYANIRQYGEAEENFQRVFRMENVVDHLQQELHFRYGRFQEWHMKSEEKAITHYLKGLKVEGMSFARDKLLNALEKLANRRVQKKVHIVESLGLLGWVHKLKGDMNKALLCYEEALRHTKELNPMF
ncbi:interferon-induced protein with tetratricopeptide repeats 1B-like isoform X2 [Octodon degus]|uniref:Interferon-induced protein with tetratricopeptide repeats 1B-like isoform X1 n=1 Tax=Octodon degus TaxID=10160 RepID=A0A6P3F7K1_OCTDE|nr:interferon-induced protein with tetratricopeptide repeats 1B-like isoform X1 [Octodon degus]XP_023571949.1 interferon-induced protein with tetratricopeptide repeats 1B-like isoform X2 [Octodon degus]